MFYRYVGLRRKAVDLYNLYQGSVVLVGGGPQHKEWVSALQHPNIVTMAMNNTAVSFRPTMWIGCDVAANYSPSILMNPTIMKFAQHNRMGCEIAGTKWRALPNTYFFNAKAEPDMKAFFQRGKFMGWWKNVFVAALQLCAWLGFNRVYAVGCGFKISKTDQYGFPSNLTDEQIAYNQRTYDMTIRQVRELLPIANEARFEIVSCTPDSKLNDLVRFRPFNEVFAELSALVPAHDTLHVEHPKKVTNADALVGKHEPGPGPDQPAPAEEHP